MTHTTSQTTCPCGKPINGVMLCSGCRRTTHFAVTKVAAHYDDLDTVRTGTTRYGGSSGGGAIGKERPLGMDIRFAPGGRGAKVQQAVRASVVTWTKALMKTHPGDAPKHDSVRSACAYLVRNLDAIVTQDWAAAFKADMLSLENSLVALVDRPADSWFAGPCGKIYDQLDEEGKPFSVTCLRVLYAEPGKDYVRCRDCGTEWPVQARRDILVREAEDRQATVRMLARVITTLGASDASEAKLEGRINTWVHRGRLISDGTRVIDGKTRATYRVGAVLELLARDISDRTGRIATRREQASERAS